MLDSAGQLKHRKISVTIYWKRVLVISGFYLCFLVNNSSIALKQCKFENYD